MSLLDTSTSKQLLQKLKSKKFNDSVVLAFLECRCYIQNLVIRQKEPISQISVVPCSNFGKLNCIWSAAEEVPLLHLDYIAHYRPYLGCCYYFASHKKICYFASSGL